MASGRLAISYLLAFAVALGVAWLVLRLNAGAAFDTPDLLFWRTIAMPILAGAAAFSLVFCLSLRLTPGPAFWAVLFTLPFVTVFGGLGLIYSGIATTIEAVVVWLAVLLGLGWLVVRRVYGERIA